MWNRIDLKKNAKANLRGKYWRAFAAALIVSILTMGSNLFTFRTNNQGMIRWTPLDLKFDFNFNNIFSGPLFGIAIILFVFFAFFGILYSLFIAPPITVGGKRWFSHNRESASAPPFGRIFSLFRWPDWLPTVGAMLWMYLWLFLWAFLLSIPAMVSLMALLLPIERAVIPIGQDRVEMYDYLKNTFGGVGMYIIVAATIVFVIALIFLYLLKAYSYRMTPWILAENPQVGYRAALKQSIQMTRGHKLGMFALDLSFIGWWLLCIITFGVGFLFLKPYYTAVQAELYADLH